MFRIILFVFLATLGAATAAEIPPKSLNELAKFYVDNNVVVGISASIFEDGKYSDFSAGLSDYESKKPVSGGTYFELGSATKVFTATLLAREVVSNRLSLDQQVWEFYPEFIGHPVGSITLVELATHTSGLPRMPDNFDPVPTGGNGRELSIGTDNENDPYRKYSKELLFESLRGADDLIKNQYSYSNVGYALLTNILMKVNNGKTYSQLVREHISDPMKVSGIEGKWTDELASDLSRKYDAALLPVPYWRDMKSMDGTGILKVTMNAMKKWISAQLNPELLPSPLREAVQLTQKIHFKTDKFDVGLGWFFDTINGVTFQNHNGSTRGFVSELYIDHTNRRAMIYMANSAPVEPGLCIVNQFTGKAPCVVDKIQPLDRAEFVEDNYVIVEKDNYTSLMIIKKHPNFDFHYMILDSGLNHRIFFDAEKREYFTDENEYVVKFFDNGHGEITEGVEKSITNSFFRIKFIKEDVPKTE
jgi:CubicO group peptidase (beta-lactamase class C family)